ncbi:hypothetical protein D3C78_873450 [compost metagenome]
MPELSASFRIAISALFFDPHRCRQNQIGRLRGNRRVHIGNNHEVLGITPAGQYFLHDVGTGLHVVAGHGPVDIDHTVLEHAALLHRVEPDLFIDGTRRHLPDFFRLRTVRRVGDHQVRGQAMGERPHFPRRATGRWLAGQRERTVARLADLAGQQMDVVDQVIGPHPARVLVETHGPE